MSSREHTHLPHAARSLPESGSWSALAGRDGRLLGRLPTTSGCHGRPSSRGVPLWREPPFAESAESGPPMKTAA